MANNFVPPPPPPPPGPPPPQNGQPQMSHYNSQPVSQQLTDKNAAYLAKMRAKQKQRASFNPPAGGGINLLGQPANNGQKKISLFGNDFLKNAQIDNNIQQTKDQYKSGGAAAKKSSKTVILPETGLTEKGLFGKYQIQSDKKIGAGAFARIKAVKGIHDGKQYALKMVKKKGRSRSDIEAFKKEILYLSKLTNHPNIIKMYDFCDSPGGLYMVLEFCNGGDVMEKMSLVKVFKESECKHIIKQLIAGICYFHQYNIVHRDLKLDNLMYNNGVLKIIDFGLAGDCTNGPLNTPCGTIHFTAPEVLSSYDYTTAADMWSVGVIIYLLICGFPPFFDNQGNEQKLFQIIKKAKFKFVNMYFDECEPCLKELIEDLLKKRPIERLTAQEVREHEWLSGIKRPRKKVNLFGQSQYDYDDDGKDNGPKYHNPFLDNKDDDKPKTVAPFMQYQQAWKKQQQAQKDKVEANTVAPGQSTNLSALNKGAPPPPGPPGPPGPPSGAGPGAVQPGSPKKQPKPGAFGTPISVNKPQGQQQQQQQYGYNQQQYNQYNQYNQPSPYGQPQQNQQYGQYNQQQYNQYNQYNQYGQQQPGGGPGQQQQQKGNPAAQQNYAWQSWGNNNNNPPGPPGSK